MIEIHDVTKRFGAVRALERVTLGVSEGTSVALFGSNGSGKTTLLKMVAGLVRPTSGEIRIDGANPRSARRRLGFLGHASYLYPYLTALENLRFYAGLYRVEETKAKEMLWRVGLPHRAGALARTLSRGETQRLSLGRALIHDPDYLLLDEPLTGMDQAAMEDFTGLVKREGRTILLSTHDREFGESFASLCVTIDKGRLSPA